MFKQFVKQMPFGISIIALALSACLIALMVPIGGNRSLIVQSGSMEPTIRIGDLILDRPQSDYQIGEIISFKDPSNPSITITHRIVGQDLKNGALFYKTKGDANHKADLNLVPAQNIIGRSDYKIVGVGKILAFAKTKSGFLAFAAIPVTLVIFLEISNIFKEVKKSKKRNAKVIYRQALKTLYQHYGKPMGVPYSSASFRSMVQIISQKWGSTHKNVIRHVSIGQHGVSIRVLAPLAAAILVVGNTQATFTDTETSTDNIFQAAAVFPSNPPNLANHLIINEVMFDPPNSSACGSENDTEWLEIYNPTAGPVNLDTWAVGDGSFTDDLPNVSLPAGGFAIISDCPQSSFSSIWPLPGGTVYIDLSSAIGNGLNNGGEQIRLLDGASLVDSLSYGSNTDAFSPSVTAPVADHSIERNPDGVDTNTAADFIDRSPPTPGT